MTDQHDVIQYQFVKQFRCVGGECPDTCCHGWNMQIDATTYARYAEDQDLLAATDTMKGCGSADHIMRRDPVTDDCTQLENGWCRLHKKYGSDLLGDACHLYPRITRKFGDQTVMSASLSCPEIARLALYGETPFTTENASVSRLPSDIKNYLSEEVKEVDAVALIAQFHAASHDPLASPERVMMRIYTVARSLSSLSQKDWPAATEFLLPTADTRLLSEELSPTDPYRLLQALVLLLTKAPKSKRLRLEQTINTMKEALAVEIDWKTSDIVPKDTEFESYASLRVRYLKHKEQLAPFLKRWIETQITMSAFPFAGFGKNLKDRATIFAVHFATVKLALMAHLTDEGLPDQETMLRVVQSLSRFLDHLADPTLSLLIYNDAGWESECRLRGLLEDVS